MAKWVRVTEQNFKEIETKCHIVLDPVFAERRRLDCENSILKKHVE